MRSLAAELRLKAQSQAIPRYDAEDALEGSAKPGREGGGKLILGHHWHRPTERALLAAPGLAPMAIRFVVSSGRVHKPKCRLWARVELVACPLGSAVTAK